MMDIILYNIQLCAKSVHFCGSESQALGIGGHTVSLQRKHVRPMELNGLLCATPTSTDRFEKEIWPWHTQQKAGLGSGCTSCKIQMPS